MNKDKIYEKKARLYPVIIAMLIPLFLIIHLSSKMIATFNQLEEIWNIAISIFPATLITRALISILIVTAINFIVIADSECAKNYKRPSALLEITLSGQ